MSELVLGMGDFNGQVGKWIDGYGGNGIGEKKVEGKMLNKVMKRSCAWQRHGSEKGRRGKWRTAQGNADVVCG